MIQGWKDRLHLPFLMPHLVNETGRMLSRGQRKHRFSAGKVYSLWVVLCAVLVVGALGTSPALAATFVVNELGDTADPNEGDGVCGTMDFFGNHCTLRAAIEESNALPGPHEILLDPSLSGTIALTSDLPALATDLDIRGIAPSRVIVDGGWAWRPFRVDTNVSVGITDLTVQSGYATAAPLQHGGALYVTMGRVTINRCRFFHNQAWLSGGAIAVIGSDSTMKPTLTVDGSLFYSNSTSGFGGAIRVSNANTTITNSTFSENSALQDGGGMALYASGAVLNNLTVMGNTADADNNGSGNGGGIYAHVINRIGNTVIAGNSDLGGEANDCNEYVHSNGYNFVGNGDGCPNVNDPTDTVGSAPKLGALALNLGFTEVHLPAADSPLVDYGGAATCSDHDQQGIPRPQDGGIGGAVCDIGAAERSHCDDGALDGDERQTDCGGSICSACACGNPQRILRIQPGAQAGVVYENFYDILMYQVADGDIFKVREDVYPDYVKFVTGGTTTLAVRLEGGYDCNKTAGSNNGYFSKIKGSLTIGDHFAVTVSNIVIM